MFTSSRDISGTTTQHSPSKPTYESHKILGECVLLWLYMPPALFQPCHRHRLSPRTFENANGRKSLPRGRHCRVSAAVAVRQRPLRAPNYMQPPVEPNERSRPIDPNERPTHFQKRVEYPTPLNCCAWLRSITVCYSIIYRPIATPRDIYTLLTSNAKYIVM